MTREDVYRTDEWKALRVRSHYAETAEEQAELCRLEAELIARCRARS